MYIQTLKNIMISKGLNRSDIAGLAGVSRAAVTKWFRRIKEDGWVNVETKTLFKLAESLGLFPSVLLKGRKDLSAYKTGFLWDRLYPDMTSFLKAVAEKRLPALARLVQVLGFYKSQAVAGMAVITLFERYKRYIHPQKRKNLEVLWPLYAGQR